MGPVSERAPDFEEALKLHLSLGELLGKLNGSDRSTTEGKRTTTNLCVYTDVRRSPVVQYRVKGCSTLSG